MGYQAYRRDRQDDPHGGIAIITKTDILCDEIHVEGSECSESIFVKINKQNDCPLIVGAIHRPTNVVSKYLDPVCTTIQRVAQMHEKAAMWLGGDFNLPDINWSNHQITGNQYPLRINNSFLEVVQDLGLEQVVDFSTIKGAYLDLFLTNRPTLIDRC